MKGIGEVVKRARKERGWSQEHLGTPLGMSRATVSALENGTFNELGIRKVERLLNRLGYTLTVTKLKQRPTLHDLKKQSFHDE